MIKIKPKAFTFFMWVEVGMDAAASGATVGFCKKEKGMTQGITVAFADRNLLFKIQGFIDNSGVGKVLITRTRVGEFIPDNKKTIKFCRNFFKIMRTYGITVDIDGIW